MTWNYSYSNFQQHGPDHPADVAFSDVFEGQAYYAELPLKLLSSIINQCSVSLDKATIKRDVNPAKWARLKEHLSTGQTVAPPWAREDCSGRLVIAQGKHRFQWAVFHDLVIVPVVVTELEAGRLRTHYSVNTSPMPP